MKNICALCERELVESEYGDISHKASRPSDKEFKIRGSDIDQEHEPVLSLDLEDKLEITDKLHQLFLYVVKKYAYIHGPSVDKVLADLALFMGVVLERSFGRSGTFHYSPKYPREFVDLVMEHRGMAWARQFIDVEK